MPTGARAWALGSLRVVPGWGWARTLQAWNFLNLGQPPGQLQTRKSGLWCLGAGPLGCEELCPGPKQVAPLACLFLVSWQVT